MARNRNSITQPVRLVDYFNKTSKFIDPLESWKILGIYRLAAQIHLLRKVGFNIITHKKPVINQWNETITVGNYELKSTPTTWNP
jgi:hypothetical protein